MKGPRSEQGYLTIEQQIEAPSTITSASGSGAVNLWGVANLTGGTTI